MVDYAWTGPVQTVIKEEIPRRILNTILEINCRLGKPKSYMSYSTE